MIVQSLWIGDSLSKLEQLCIKSFLAHNYDYHLYVYQNIEGIPEGTSIKDGNEILDKSEIYQYKNGSYSAFSNMFRFRLLFLKGGFWVDTDLVCLKLFPSYFLENKYVFTSEPSVDYKSSHICAGLIKIPKGDSVALEGYNIQRNIKQSILLGKITWSAGPKTVKFLVHKYKIRKYVTKWQTICSCSFKDVRTLINTDYKNNTHVINSMEKIPRDMYAIHLWNNMWTRNNLDKNKSYPANCMFETLKRLYKV